MIVDLAEWTKDEEDGGEGEWWPLEEPSPAERFLMDRLAAIEKERVLLHHAIAALRLQRMRPAEGEADLREFERAAATRMPMDARTD